MVSIFVNIILNRLRPMNIKSSIGVSTSGSAITKMYDSFTLMRNDMTAASTIMIGARNIMRRNIWYVFCRLLTSVVARMTSDEVWNRSVFLKENCRILPKIRSRRFFAKPIDATADVRAASAPHKSDSSDASTISPPTHSTNCRLFRYGRCEITPCS